MSSLRADSVPASVELKAEAMVQADCGCVNADARRWSSLAVGSLVLAGLLSLAVVVGRLPFISNWIADPLFFKRCLVVHVDLSLSVWFYGFIASLLALRFRRDSGILGRIGFYVASLGVAGMIAGGLAKGAEPVLSNYIPVIDHPLFLGGLAAFFVGVLFCFGLELSRSGKDAEGPMTRSARIGLQASALLVTAAAVTWVSAVSGMPKGVDTTTFYEFSIWGAGHVLQVANAAAMMAVWLWVLEKATGQAPLSLKGVTVLFSILAVPHFSLPLLTYRGTMDTLYHAGATQLMRWGIFPVMLTLVAIGSRHLWKHRSEIKSPAAKALRAGFIASVSLSLLGVCLGLCIRGSNTLVPAHYHASLGGVTVAFMTAAFLIVTLARRGDNSADKIWKSARRQLILFAVGQSVFAIGFGIGGVYGLGRKAYASEQHVRSLGEYVGLWTMGLGGIVAMVAGLWFLALVLREIYAWWFGRSGQNRISSINPVSEL
ncbi:hypothetical protein IEN85_09725 [Pelagicoccus sp. NFK12]|uniref:Cytochrome C oxidase subunit I n=1 Tax=Pelagicoccus enzymogenes TaxID=2773457 RepID=A0A927F8A9_9BACT|nr:hypothetical protein [Pelagicoccus enzymogenes]MBD5779770.1 hypothetical protein [Pelagicoccus enzymogenes]